MSPVSFALLSGTLTFGVPLVLAMREIVATGPTRGRKPRRDDGPTPPKRPTPRDDWDGRKLPACLLPPYPPLPPEYLDDEPLPLLEHAK